MEHLRPGPGKSEHIPIVYRAELHRVRYQARVGGIYAVDIGVDLAAVALERYGEAKSIYEDFLEPTDSRLGGLYNNMALACVSLKEYDRARELYQKAIEVMSALPGGKPETAITYLNLANAAEAQQGLENADGFISDCLQTAEELLLDGSNAQDGNYAFVCEKCAPTFEYYGWFMTAEELKRRSDGIYERT